jgi:hypothetical protein
MHRERRIVAGLPEHLPGVRIERRHHLTLTLPGELVDPIANHKRRRVARADLHLPLLRQLLRPRFGIGWRRRRAVATRSTPLVPVIRSALRLQWKNENGEKENSNKSANHQSHA